MLDHVTCDVFTKEPQGMDFLQVRFGHSSVAENNQSYIL